ncbi:hypothetical protein JCGZ_04534 [Jatropha curcas]|uniref:Aluminum-activated malate transporter n=1 Tax=Jatropha curcas TaxID=180498 RepID=A0A067LNZ7_JATCU|nr:aluminum-activated malate transporter 2 [Jatropha curcas]KDP46600.1 hypothetical protein JCGZ_04534 [Jatropha curcas]
MASQNQESEGGETVMRCRWVRVLPNRLWDNIVEIGKKGKEIGKEDPRRIIHSLKAGLALTLVTLLYSNDPLYEGFGVNAMWAVLTVVVVFEFSVGATLGKGFNRMVATSIAGFLGFGAHRLAALSGRGGEPIFIAFLVFIISAIATFARFFPALKARYDYGLTIFILTFCLVSVSGYRDEELLGTTHTRVSTIAIGSFTAIFVCIGICPVWIGEDLHNLVVGNIEKLGNFLEGFGNEYFKVSEEKQSNNDKPFLKNYKSVLSSKSSEESMANLARWEPCHGRFRFFHPWKQYLKIGSLARECAYKIEALNNYLNPHIQTPMEIQNKFVEPCTKLSVECGKALKEIASATKKMRRSNSAAIHIANAKAAAENVKFLLQINLSEGALLVYIIPTATVATLLLEVLQCIEKIYEAINELAAKAHFKNVDPTVSPEQPHLLHRGTVKPMPNNLGIISHVVTI